MTKIEMAAELARLRSELSGVQFLCDARGKRLDEAKVAFRALTAQNRELSIKLCGQIKRGNLLKERVVAATH